MRLPRDISGAQLVAALRRVGYERSRQTGSHVRLTHAGPPQHHVTVPMHDALRLGTLSSIVESVAQAQFTSKEALINTLFG
jgi:predicted RNA binding protein YcfA (HicA-like mRNA interferase family)